MADHEQEDEAMGSEEEIAKEEVVDDDEEEEEEEVPDRRQLRVSPLRRRNSFRINERTSAVGGLRRL